MKEILNKKHYRKIFYTVIVVILAVTALVRFLLDSYVQIDLQFDFLIFFSSFLDNLMISLIITVLIGSFIFWLTPDIVKKSVMEVINPKEINPLFNQALIETKTWTVKGVCGRYTRATTLPRLANAGKHEGIVRDITIILLDPDNIRACEEYANYRRSLKSAKSRGPWTTEKVREEILATVLTALKFRYEEPLLSIDIFLTQTFSAFRLDISDQYAIVTKEDKQASGLRADSGTYFYNSYKDDLRLVARQSRCVKYDKPLNILDKSTEQELKKLVLDSDLLSEENIDNVNFDNVKNYILEPIDPYK